MKALNCITVVLSNHCDSEITYFTQDGRGLPVSVCTLILSTWSMQCVCNRSLYLISFRQFASCKINLLQSVTDVVKQESETSGLGVQNPAHWKALGNVKESIHFGL